jgi:NTE family protein
MKSVGIALGGGGAKGLAHVPMLQVLEDLALTPAMISGTSMGAIIGALYAAGVKPRS